MEQGNESREMSTRLLIFDFVFLSSRFISLFVMQYFISGGLYQFIFHTVHNSQLKTHECRIDVFAFSYVMAVQFETIKNKLHFICIKFGGSFVANAQCTMHILTDSPERISIAFQRINTPYPILFCLNSIMC